MFGECYDKIIFENSLFPLTVRLSKCVTEKTISPLTTLTWHEELEIKFFHKGVAKLQIGAEIITAREGDIILVNPCEPHSTIAVEGEVVYDALVMNINFLKEKFTQAERLMQFTPFAEGRLKLNSQIQDGKIKKAIELLFLELASEGKNNETAISGILLYLFALLFESQIKNTSGSTTLLETEKLKKIQPAIEYINKNYAKPLSLEYLAELCMINSTYFSKLFKHVMGINFSEYINGLRLNSAEILLSTTRDKIASIALACGYEDVCYFSRWFKRNKGMTPGEYRKSNL